MHIRKKQNKFYLKHSFRKNKKVITKEIYLGLNIPKNISKIKKEFTKQIFQETSLKKLKLIQKNFKKEWKTFPESIKRKVLIDFSINFIYNTNAIEGSTITLHETEELIKQKISPHKSLTDVQETINHSIIFLKSLSEKKMNLKVLLNWHKKIFKDSKADIAGKIREHMMRVGPYIAPDWQDLHKLLKQFFKGYTKTKKTNKKEEKINPVEFAARIHYRFEKIHPFGDGNGRIGRLIIANILRCANYPLIIIEVKKRRSYYFALNKSEDEFVRYFIKRYINFNKRYLE